MTDDLIARIQTFTLAARTALEAEAGQQLEGIYGWLPDGTFGSAKEYPALDRLDEARETRQRLEQFAEDETAAGLDATGARRKLIRETAFTWLNRFAAFRLMEERKLLKPTIVRLAQSNGFIFWLTDEKTPEGQQAYALHQQGPLPLNAMGEGPRDAAYRRFLLWQCGELARDVSVLFDPNTLASRLCPRPALVQQIVTDMNAEALADAWKAGNEETIGWIYEGFIQQENKEVFAKFSNGKKVIAEEIGAATQRFTPRWIVRFLVENSLGRLWLEMHPDSRLVEKMAYLVPVEKQIARPLKPACEITFLDPCAGSMHFGFVAFDLFVEMYREELELAGQPGWPAKASVANADEIAARVAANNLFGIDIDARAVQIAGLALLIKTWTLQPKARVSDLNLACANVELISGGRLDAFINQAKFTHPIYERILRNLSARMKDSDQMGSLLRLEKFLEQLITEERLTAEADTQFHLSFRGLDADQFKTREGIEEFFGILSEQVLRHLDDFVRASRATGADAGHFVSEAAKGLRYLRLVSRHHDVVATNPPYMSRRNMSAVMAQHLDEHYSEAKGDLYAAFIARCVELAGPLGKVAMVTQQSFMFISSYEGLRKKLRSAVAIETMAHLGPKAFPNITGEKVNITAFVLRREPDDERRQEQVGHYFRVVKAADAAAKHSLFIERLHKFRESSSADDVYSCRQEAFDAVAGSPWLYWINEGVRELFRTYPNLGSISAPRAGMHGGDLFRFGRFWWEIGARNVGRGIRTKEEAFSSKKKWFPYMKGGEERRWYGNQEWVVTFDEPHYRILSECGNKLPSREYYFKAGVTWTEISSGRFCCRLSPGGFIFDAKGSTCFTEHPFWVLPLLSSRFADYCFQLLNPTVSVQAGDIARLPVPSKRSKELEDLATEAVRVMRSLSVEDETTYDFVSPCWNTSLQLSLEGLSAKAASLMEIERALDVSIFDLYALSQVDRQIIEQEVEEVPSLSLSDPIALTTSWISYAFGAVLGRYEIGKQNGFGCGNFTPEAVAAIRNLIDSDGMMASDLTHPQDIAKRVLACLELMQGRSDAHTTIRTAAEDDRDPEDLLRDWIDRDFWKYHYQLYRKRPVYWPLQSPKKKFIAWVFHERFSKDTLFRVRDLFVQVKINWLNGRINDLKPKSASSDTRERRAAEKEISRLSDVLDDVEEFAERIERVIARGYTPHIDDGVLLNAAPLWELLPAWPETKKAWQALEAGDYDWAQQAMEYWPERVKEACRTNKSFAIAHGLA